MATIATAQLNVQKQSAVAPSVTLVTPSKTQVPTHIVHSINNTAGEEPLYLVHMKDGTYVYLKQSLLSQSGGVVNI